MSSFPKSIAIAGAWGYIGQHFLRAAHSLGLRCLAYDPGPTPPEWKSVQRFEVESEFYEQPADLFHLATHPEHREFGMRRLLERSRQERIFVLCEKPMAPPDDPHRCAAICDAVARSSAMVLYDFPELYDPVFRRIIEFLGKFEQVRIDSIYLQRSKDREDAGNPRNRKRMVSIQYQESVHCIAFALFVLSSLAGSTASVLDGGVSLEGHAKPYQPPNPEVYPHVVDGYCTFQGTIGRTAIEGCTNFLRGAPWAKRRVLRGVGDGQPFVIDADFLENDKRLLINGLSHPDAANTNSYAEVIKTCGHYGRTVDPTMLRRGLFPHPDFTRLTYQLSSILWRSCHDRRRMELGSTAEVLDFNADFAAISRELPRYG